MSYVKGAAGHDGLTGEQEKESLMNEADWWIEETPSDLKLPRANPRRIVWGSVLLLGLPLTFGVFFFLLRGH
jgi:hypothetical protein